MFSSMALPCKPASAERRQRVRGAAQLQRADIRGGAILGTAGNNNTEGAARTPATNNPLVSTADLKFQNSDVFLVDNFTRAADRNAFVPNRQRSDLKRAIGHRHLAAVAEPATAAV